jgi:hypothetical protein
MAMDEPAMIEAILASPTMVLLLQLGFHLLLGGLVGLFYFRAVRLSADLIAHGRRVALAIALTVARLLLVGGLAVLVVREGALPLLAFALGFLLARALAMRRIRAIS